MSKNNNNKSQCDDMTTLITVINFDTVPIGQ